MRVEGLGFRVQGFSLGFRVQGLRFRVLGFRVGPPGPPPWPMTFPVWTQPRISDWQILGLGFRV